MVRSHQFMILKTEGIDAPRKFYLRYNILKILESYGSKYI